MKFLTIFGQIVCRISIQDAAIIPQNSVTHRPIVAVLEPERTCMLRQLRKKGTCLVIGPADDTDAGLIGEVECLSTRMWVCPDEWPDDRWAGGFINFNTIRIFVSLSRQVELQSGDRIYHFQSVTKHLPAIPAQHPLALLLHLGRVLWRQSRDLMA